MPRRATPLAAGFIAKAKPGRYCDGGGLYLLVRGPELRWWVFRYRHSGRLREMGLGAAAGPTAVSLKDARIKARRLFDLHRDGHDPIELKRTKIAAERVEAAKAITFKEEASAYIASHAAGWRNEKHAQQWENTLRDYVYPMIGALPVSMIDVGLVLKCLEPIWSTKPETASRVRGRIEAVLDAAKARGHRAGENPARWKGNLKHLLAEREKVEEVHLEALPYVEIAGFMTALRKHEGTAARALEFLILTAARTGEVLGATWDEIDLAGTKWTIPSGRMKGGRSIERPLSAGAIELLGDPGTGYLFPRPGSDQPLRSVAMLALLRRMGHVTVTIHGFRSTFRDWVAERTNYPSEVAEAALAHAVNDKVLAAYRRTDFFERRRRLAADWAAFCAMPPQEGSVTPLRGRAR
jgi:integrase